MTWNQCKRRGGRWIWCCMATGYTHARSMWAFMNSNKSTIDNYFWANFVRINNLIKWKWKYCWSGERASERAKKNIVQNPKWMGENQQEVNIGCVRLNDEWVVRRRPPLAYHWKYLMNHFAILLFTVCRHHRRFFNFNGFLYWPNQRCECNAQREFNWRFIG